MAGRYVSNSEFTAQHFGEEGLPVKCGQTPVWELRHSSGQSIYLCEYHVECFWGVWTRFRDAVRDVWPVKVGR